MEKIGVIQLIDNLEPGGAEMMAVNIANHLPHARYESHLCSSRQSGPLAALLDPHVKHLNLRRSHRLDLAALIQLANYIRDFEVRIVHAHETSLFIAAVVSILTPQTIVIWHDHFGRCEVVERPAWFYRQVVRFVDGVISVNSGLADWAVKELHFPEGRVWYVPNFVSSRAPKITNLDLPGEPGSRIVCVANLRPEKGHLNLLQAMNEVVKVVPQAHLLIVGAVHDARYLSQIEIEIQTLKLGNHITLMGLRQDIPEILEKVDIAVISSHSEGLPLVLLEYGLASLPVVCTDVGQCRDVVNGGKAGILIPASDSFSLAQGLIQLLESRSLRFELGSQLEEQVKRRFSQDVAIDQIDQVYEALLSSG